MKIRSQYEKDRSLIPGAIRVRPDEDWARTRHEEQKGSQIQGQRIVAYFT